MPKKPTIKIDPSASPWHTQPVTGMQVCHYCGHEFAVTKDIRQQHNYGCHWLQAYLREAATNVIPGGPQLLVEDDNLPMVDEPDDFNLKNIDND